jgi:DNA-binding MarR family transcriptional regulator
MDGAGSPRRQRGTRRRTEREYQVSQAVIASSVASAELRELIARLPLWSRPGYLVRRLHQIHNAMFLEECGAFDLTPVQYGLLTTLAMRREMDQITLAKEVGLDRTNVADVLRRLQRRGLVSRHRSPADRRMVLARLTAKGEKLTLAMHTAMSRAQTRLLEPLPAAEKERFMATLLRLVDSHNHVSRAALGSSPEDDAA